jgi:hypothetical protein
MSLFEDTNSRALKDLLAEIHNRTTALPDFQRDFVWEPGATQELIVSIANNYPAGTILRVRDANRVFAARAFDGAPALGDAKHTFLVLDGQQRLTSLYQAFYGVGEHRYFLDVRKLLDGVDFEEAIFHVRASTKWARRREELAMQAEEMLLPIAALRGGIGSFHVWARDVTRTLDGTKRNELEDALHAAAARWIPAIDDYRFPVVTLSEKTSPAALCTIFETLNRTGVKLSVFELLTARFWPQDIDLRRMWENAQAKHRVIEHFAVDPYYVLQAISLACRKTPSCKRGDVLDMTEGDIREWWDRTVDGMARGLDILRDDCKVMLPKWLPYQTILPPLAAVLAIRSGDKGAATGAARAKLKQWFWCAVFGQVYENAPNSKSAKDVVELCAWLDGGPSPESVAKFRFDPKTLRDTTPHQRSIYRGAICLTLGAGRDALDFHKASPVTSSLMTDQGIDDHHVFPAAHLDRQRAPKTLRDCVLNRTLIDRTTNQTIGDRPPSAYLGDLRATKGFPFEPVLASHCLPTGADSPLLQDDFDRFLEWRQNRLWQEIQRVTGATVAADLESPDEAAS